MLMRNIPFPFLMEDTPDSIAEQAQRLRAINKFKAKSVRIPRRDIGRNWNAIENHKWFLSERLGRNVGTAVAAQDYFSHIAAITQPRTDLRSRLATAFDRIIESEGLQAFSNVQRVMRGVPNWPAFDLPSSPEWLGQRGAKSVRLPAHLIEAHVCQIEEHKWFLSERLGRDVGTSVAALDFLENIRPSLKRTPWTTRLARTLDRMMESSGPHSIANLERAMRARY